jgi:hypothetical protein
MESLAVKAAFSLNLIVAMILLLDGIAIAQSIKMKGVINGRSGASMTLQTQDSEKVTVILTDSTEVEEPEGAFRKKHLAMTALRASRLK